MELQFDDRRLLAGNYSDTSRSAWRLDCALSVGEKNFGCLVSTRRFFGNDRRRANLHDVARSFLRASKSVLRSGRACSVLRVCGAWLGNVELALTHHANVDLWRLDFYQH